MLGYPEKALASIADALALAERIAHPFTLSIALTLVEKGYDTSDFVTELRDKAATTHYSGA